MAETTRSMRADWRGRARDNDGAARQTSSTAAGRGSTTRPGGKRSATEGGLGCGGGDGMRRRDDARCGPGGWRGRAGVEDDGGAAETSSTAGRGWATEARSKMAVATAMIDM